METKEDYRSEILKSFAATSQEIIELLHYNKSLFQGGTPKRLPLEDEPFVERWLEYEQEAKEIGTIETLQQYFPQLQFPVFSGIQFTECYQNAVEGGQFSSILKSPPLAFSSPQEIKLEIYSSLAGRIPCVICENRNDFVALVQAFALKNEPKLIPDSMGACFIKGYKNWDRYAKWIETNNQETSKESSPPKEHFQDKFILLSKENYSSTVASELELSEEKWREYSLDIRKGHETAHYYTQRVYGSMQNNLLDELIADYMGITQAIGRFRADWFLRFLGLENFPHYRIGGRLQNYRGEPALSDGAFRILQKLVKSAAEQIEKLDEQISERSLVTQGRLFEFLTHFSLEELAAPEGFTLLQQSWNQLKESYFF